MPNTTLSVQNLSHRYGSSEWAVKDLSFEIDRKAVLGLLGANGAGKSTAMNIICGALNQTSGKVLIDGIDVRKNPVEAKMMIGYLPQKAPLHTDLTVDEYLRHAALLRRMTPAAVPAAVSNIKEQCGIAHFSKRLIRNLSGGYQQRVGIAQAIIHQPKLVVLDEPTNGLDPVQIVEVRKLIREVSRTTAVMLSTHILSEIQAVCGNIRMIEKGKTVFDGTVQKFANYIAPNSFVMSLLSPPHERELHKIEGVNEVELLDKNKIRVVFDDALNSTEKFVELGVRNGWRIQEISLERSALDDVFERILSDACR